MRGALWILVLFASAVAAALFLSNNRATVTLFWHPWRIDLSLNLLLVLTATVLALTALLIHAILSVWRMPMEAKVWRDHRHDIAAHHAFVRAVEQYAQEQWSQALEEVTHAQQLMATLPAPANPRQAQEHQSLLQATAWLAQQARQRAHPQQEQRPEQQESPEPAPATATATVAATSAASNTPVLLLPHKPLMADTAPATHAPHTPS